MSRVDSVVSELKRLNPDKIVTVGDDSHYVSVYSRVPLRELKLPEGFYVDEDQEFILDRDSLKGGTYTILPIRPYREKEERLTDRRETTPEAKPKTPSRGRNMFDELYRRYTSSDRRSTEPVREPVRRDVEPVRETSKPIPTVDVSKRLPMAIEGREETRRVAITIDYPNGYKPSEDEYDELENLFVEKREAATTPVRYVMYDRARAAVKAASAFNGKLKYLFASGGNPGKLILTYEFSDLRTYQSFMDDFPDMVLSSVVTMEQAKARVIRENEFTFNIDKLNLSVKVTLNSDINFAPSSKPVKATPALFKTKKANTDLIYARIVYSKAAALVKACARYATGDIEHTVVDGNLVFNVKFKDEKTLQDFLRSISSWTSYFERKIDEPTFDDDSGTGLVLK